AEWQQGRSSELTSITGYAMAYDLDLVSTFTFFLDDPVHGDQVEQIDRRLVAGMKISHRRLGKWRGRPVQKTIGLDLRNDNIPEVALYHTQARERLEVRSLSAALVTTGGLYAQNEIKWTSWFKTLLGLRGDASRYRVDALELVNSGTAYAGLVSPKGGATIGPWKATEFYVNAGSGFHSNNALGTTIT